MLQRIRHFFKLNNCGKRTASYGLLTSHFETMHLVRTKLHVSATKNTIFNCNLIKNYVPYRGAADLGCRILIGI